jgi:hypothetical protein
MAKNDSKLIEAKYSHSRLLHQKVEINGTSSFEYISTTTPSEPVVSEAVTKLLCENDNWTNSIKTLATRLLGAGLVEKGVKGELYARLLCILARDFHFTKITEKNSEFPYAEPFSVKSFLQSLFNNQWHDEIMNFTPAKPQTRTWAGTENASFDEVFNRGYMNFTHFTHTDVHLEGSTMPDLLHILLRRQAALQLAFYQPVWNILIPVYFGDLEKDFDPTHASAILIQVRNRDTPSPVSLETDLHHYRAKFSHTDDPILYILMDLGTKVHAVDVHGLPKAASNHPPKRSPKNPAPLQQHIFSIHAAGAYEKTYGCLQDQQLKGACQELFAEVMQTDGRDIRRHHDDLCKYNNILNYHSWDSHFSIIKKANTEQDAAMPDHDIPMAGMEEITT